MSDTPLDGEGVGCGLPTARGTAPGPVAALAGFDENGGLRTFSAPVAGSPTTVTGNPSGNAADALSSALGGGAFADALTETLLGTRLVVPNDSGLAHDHAVKIESPPRPFAPEQLVREIEQRLDFHKIPKNLLIVLKPRIVFDIRVDLRDPRHMDADAQRVLATEIAESVVSTFDGKGRRLGRPDECPL